MKRAFRVFTLIALIILVASLTIIGKSEATEKEYLVRKGDMLSSIGARHKVPWQKIYEANRKVITHPKKWLFPGQRLIIPGTANAEAKAEKPIKSTKKIKKKEKPEPKEKPESTEKSEVTGKKEAIVEVVSPLVKQTIQHTVKKEDSLWLIYQKYYNNEATKNKIKALAFWNNIKKSSLILPGQKIKIFQPLILIQSKTGVNPTTVHLRTAVGKAIDQFRKSLNEVGIEVNLPTDLLDQIHIGISLSKEKHILNGEIVASATFSKSAQGWTKIITKEEIFGKSVIVELDNSYGVRAVYVDQCKNVYLQLIKITPPPPPKPPPIVKLYSQPLQAFIEVLYQDATCRDCQLDFSGGGQWQDYSDGAEDYTDWLYAAVRCHVWTDKYGNKHKPGVYVNGSRFDGNWQEKFDFEGEVITFGVEYRIETPEGREYIFRLGYQDRKQSGSSEDIWGSYRTDYKYDAIVFEAEIDDTSRINELWFPRWKAGIGLVQSLSRERTSTWTNADTGQVINLNESPDVISGLAIKAEVDFFSDSRNLLTASAELWHNFLFDGDMVTKVTPYLGILGDSLKIGYQFTNRNTNGSHATGTGLAWQIHLYDLYRYMEAKRWERPTGTGTFTNPNSALNVAISSATESTGGENVNPFADPNKALTL
jgi:LysM repeat protein